MKKRVILLVAACGLSAFAACSDRTSTTEPPMSLRRGISQNANDAQEVRGRMTHTMVIEQNDGTRSRFTKTADIEQSWKNDGTPNARASKMVSNSEERRIAKAAIMGMPFRTPTGDTTINGRPAKKFMLQTRRVAKTMADGHNVEVHEVPAAVQGKQPVGLLVVIDGVMRQQYELSYASDGKKLNTMRSLTFGADGRLQAEETTDVSKLVASRLSVAQASGLQKAFGRLLRGAGNLVLPDELQAQDPESDPCNPLVIGVESSLIAFALAAAAEAAAIATCWFGIGCAAIPFFAEGIAAALVALAATYVLLNECRGRHPACPNGTWGSNGTCPSTGTGGSGGGSGGNPGGSGNNGGSQAGTGGGTGAGSGGWSCGWVQYDLAPENVGEVWSVWSNWECHRT